jgi:hypothetical protein
MSKSENRIGHRGRKLNVWQNLSHSSPDKVYETIYWENGNFTCNCRGWILPKNGNPRTCRHVKSAQTTLYRTLNGLKSDVPIPEYEYPESSKTQTFTHPFPPLPIEGPPTPKKYHRMIRVMQ